MREKEAITRRELFGRGRKVAEKGTVLAGGALLAKGIGLPNMEYLLNPPQDVQLILSNHKLGKTRLDDELIYTQTGDLRRSVWNKAGEELVDASMRKAREQGRPYYCVVDGLTPYTLIPDKSSVDWYGLPHPKLRRKDRYPQEIYMVGAEATEDFGLFADQFFSSNPAVKEQMEHLIKDTSTWYSNNDSYLRATVNQDVSALATNTLGSMLAVRGLIDGKDVSRRGILALGVGWVASQGLKTYGRGSPIDKITGNRSSREAQRILTGIGNISEREFPRADKHLLTYARTAWAIEKGYDLAKSVGQPIRLLYGSGHSKQSPIFLTDRSYRLTVVEVFVKDLLTRLDGAITEKYGELLPYRDRILTTAAFSITKYGISGIDMPWGRNTIPPEQIAEFEKNLVTSYDIHGSSSLTDVVNKVLVPQLHR